MDLSDYNLLLILRSIAAVRNTHTNHKLSCIRAMQLLLRKEGYNVPCIFQSGSNRTISCNYNNNCVQRNTALFARKSIIGRNPSMFCTHYYTRNREFSTSSQTKNESIEKDDTINYSRVYKNSSLEGDVPAQPKYKISETNRGMHNEQDYQPNPYCNSNNPNYTLESIKIKNHQHTIFQNKIKQLCAVGTKYTEIRYKRKLIDRRNSQNIKNDSKKIILTMPSLKHYV